MEVSVFGTPITTETLQGLPEYSGKLIRRIDRAHVALNMINADNKNQEAIRFVDSLKSDYGNGVSTLALVYNATGDTIEFITNRNWYGSHIWKNPYPAQIANGQWGVFLHVHPSAQAYGSFGAVVYRGKNEEDKTVDWMTSWSVPWGSSPNSAYAMVRESGYFNEFVWDTIAKRLYGSGKYSTDESDGGYATASMGGGTSPQFVSQFTLKGAQDAQPVDSWSFVEIAVRSL